MAAHINRLNSKKVGGRLKPGRHADGGNLYLLVTPSDARRWVFMYRWNGRQREMSLGPLRDVRLAKAREMAEAARGQLRDGKDPITERSRQQDEESRVPTFAAFVSDLLDGAEVADKDGRSRRSVGLLESFRNEKHRAQWRMTLTEYCKPIADRPIDEIDTNDLLTVLQPVWSKVPETASRLRGRIEKVLAAAKARGLRDGPNPAIWRGHLDTILPRRQKLSRGHHAALPYLEMHDFWQKLAPLDSVSASALKFAILTAARSGEVRLALWSEIDLDAKTWSIPAERMKAGKLHRVPLTDTALAVLAEMQGVRARQDQDGFIFPARDRRKPFSVMALAMVLRGISPEVTVHGFRSTFRDWAAEKTNHPTEVAEAALAHTVSNQVEAAYRRGDLFEKRRNLMADWERHVTRREKAQVIQLQPAWA